MEWIEAVRHLRARYRVGQVTDEWIELWWRFRDGRLAIRQQQTLWIAEVNGVPYFIVASEVGVPRRLRAAVLQQPRIGIGTLVEDDDRLEMRLTLPAHGLTPETLDRVLYAIAYEAVQLSMEVQAPRPAEREALRAS